MTYLRHISVNQLCISDPSTLHIQAIKYKLYIPDLYPTHQIYVYIRPINYTYPPHKVYISDPSNVYQTHQINHSHPLYIHITPIRYRYQTNISYNEMFRFYLLSIDVMFSIIYLLRLSFHLKKINAFLNVVKKQFDNSDDDATADDDA